MEDPNYCNITYVPQPSLQNPNIDENLVVVNLDVNLTYVPLSEFGSGDMRIEDYLYQSYQDSVETNLEILLRDSTSEELISELLVKVSVPEDYQDYLVAEILKNAREISNSVMIGERGFMNVEIGIVEAVDVDDDDMEEEEDDFQPSPETNINVMNPQRWAIAVEYVEEEENMDMDMNVRDEGNYGIMMKLECVLNTEEGLDCAICFEQIQVGMEVDRMPTCPHLFHEHCISTWFLRKKSCPLCRAEPS